VKRNISVRLVKPLSLPNCIRVEICLFVSIRNNTQPSCFVITIAPKNTSNTFVAKYVQNCKSRGLHAHIRQGLINIHLPRSQLRCQARGKRNKKRSHINIQWKLKRTICPSAAMCLSKEPAPTDASFNFVIGSENPCFPPSLQSHFRGAPLACCTGQVSLFTFTRPPQIYLIIIAGIDHWLRPAKEAGRGIRETAFCGDACWKDVWFWSFPRLRPTSSPPTSLSLDLLQVRFTCGGARYNARVCVCVCCIHACV